MRTGRTIGKDHFTYESFTVERNYYIRIIASALTIIVRKRERILTNKIIIGNNIARNVIILY